MYWIVLNNVHRIANFMRNQIRQFLRRHRRLYKASLIMRGKPTNIRLILPSDHVSLTQEWAKELPNNFDLIIGIPRAGLIIADTLALYYGAAWSTPLGFERGEIYFSHQAPLHEVKNILVVDDSISKGKELFAAANEIKSLHPTFTVKTGSLFVTKEAAELVDYYFRVPDGIELWYGNLENSLGRTISADLDGVLCKNPPSQALLNSEAFSQWVSTAQRNYIPHFRLQSIVTSRPNAFRRETEKWLAENNVQYDKLIMLDESAKRTPGFSIAHKVANLKKLKPDCYWESSFQEAKEINKLTGIPTYCTDEMVIFGVAVK